MTTLFHCIVVKIGTGVLCSRTGHLKNSVFRSVLHQVSSLRTRGINTVIVSSGAIHSARVWLRAQEIRYRPALKDDVLASVGQPILMEHWRKAGEYFAPIIPVSQILVTGANLTHRQEWDNITRVVKHCLARGIAPIVNQNDAVSFEEMKLMLQGVSENDQLAAIFASALRARAILFLTESGGVFNGHPKKAGTVRYREVDWRNPPLLTESHSSHGRGGMREKLRFAIECRKTSIKRVAIAELTPESIVDFATGKDISTMVGTRNLIEG